MAYAHTNAKGVTYYLHGRTRILKSGKELTLYFFSKKSKMAHWMQFRQGMLYLKPKMVCPF